MERLDFSSADTQDDVINLIMASQLPQKERVITAIKNINRDNYDRLITLLKRVGLTIHDELRIFKYRGGRFRFENLAKQLPSQDYNPETNYLILDSILLKQYPKPSYLTHEDGIIIPFYYDGRNFIFLPDSNYFIRGSKILITPTIYEGIQFVTNYRLETDRLDVLLRKIDPDTNYIYVKELGIIYNINGDYLYAKNLEEISYISAIRVLDEFNQPYPKSFMLSQKGLDKRLLELIREPDTAFLTNAIITQDFVEGKGAKFYQDLGITNLCTNPTLELLVTQDDKISDIIPPHLMSPLEKYPSPREVIHNIMTCREPILVQPIGLIIQGTKVQRHLIVLIFNITQGRGYLFDPSYHQGVAFERVYTNIIRYFKRALREVYPDLSIRSMSEFGCPFGYALQERGDMYCRSWSMYLTILYLLNPDKSFDEIVVTLYEIEFPGIRVIIPRFLMWIFRDNIDIMLNIYHPRQEKPQEEIKVPEEKPITIEECQDIVKEWGWINIPLVAGKPNYNLPPEEIGIVTGKSSGIVVLTISSLGLDYWEEVLGENFFPITFTVVSRDGSYSYYFLYKGTADIPNLVIGDDISFHTTNDYVVAPCFDQYEIVKGFSDRPIIAELPNWLHLFLLESLQESTKQVIDYTTLRVVDLKQLLRQKGLPFTGRKEDLIRRLQEDDIIGRNK